MRFLGIGDSCDLGAIYLRLLAEGHEVKVSVAEPLCAGTLAGMVEHVPDWRAELDWVRAVGGDGVILFENVYAGSGAAQDALRRDGFNVVGGSAFGDRLENDRGFGQRVLAELGLPIAPVREFRDRTAALAFLDAHPGRYALKFNALGSHHNYVGVFPDGRDLRAYLAHSPVTPEEAAQGFVLMDFVEGVEMGIGAYFDGQKFLRPACLDWEHKRFFPGDRGELTGEMGTVVTYDRSARFFDRTLGRVEELLRTRGYCGYINLNTIVNERGIWPLEFTCRFGYPGFAILDPLQETGWAELFRSLTGRSAARFATRPGFAVGVVLTTPPFPYATYDVAEPVGLPVLFDGALTEADRRNLHYGEVGLHDGQLVTSGVYGWTMVATGVGATIGAARDRANALARRVLIPNVRFREDIGDRLIARDYARVERWGLLDPL